LNSNINPIGLL